MSAGPVPVAQTVSCARCGGAIPLTGVVSRVRCPYCRTEQDVAEDRIAALEAYRRSAGDVAARTALEHQKRAQWTLWYRPDGKARAGRFAPLVIALPGMLFYGVTMALAQAQVIPHGGLEAILSTGMLTLFGLSFVGYFGLGFVRRARAGAPESAVAAACPRCGGPLSFGLGRLVERCGHCGASLVAGATVMDRALDAARAELRRAAMDRCRVERNAMASVAHSVHASWMPYIIVGSWLPVLGGGATAFTVDYFTNPRSDTPLGALALLWALALANVAVIVVVATVQRRRRHRWRTLARAAAASLGGRVSVAPAEWVAWLNAMWPGPYDVARLVAGPFFHAVTGAAGGYPVAIDLDPVPANREDGAPHADVFLAATMRDGDWPQLPEDIARRADTLGFVPSASEAGLVATATRATLGTMKESAPGPSAEGLVAAAMLLAEWATRIGSAPASPLP